jgi:hypothetical protein
MQQLIYKIQFKFPDRIFANLMKLSSGSDHTLNIILAARTTEINDILLTGLGIALRDWARQDKVLINSGGHGREEIINRIDITRTVGWFTTQYPVLLDISESEDVSYNIMAVKETLRRIPNKGIGYGILTAKKGNEAAEIFVEPEVSFNYLGQFQEANTEAGFINVSQMSCGDIRLKDIKLTHALITADTSIPQIEFGL